jgi:MFS family permease
MGEAGWGEPGRSRNVQLFLYIAADFMYWMALYLYVPTLPVYVQTKTDNLALVGVILAMYGLWQALIRLPLGIAADWLGRRKPFILIGFALTALGAWWMGASGTVSGLLVGRSVTGLAAGTWVPIVVAFSGLFPSGEAVRATAMLTMVSSVSRMVATGVTGTLNAWGGYSLAFFLAAGMALAAMVTFLPAKESKRSVQAPALSQVGRLISRRDVLLPSSLNAIAQYVAWAATFSFFPILARQLGADDVTLSVLTSMNIGIVLAANVLTTVLVRQLGSQRMIYVSFVLQAAGLGLAAGASSLWQMFVAQFCLGSASGIGYPILMGMSIEHVADRERTTAMGLHQAVYALGMFGGPWLSGVLADAVGLQPMFGLTAFGCLLFGLLGARMLKAPELARA